MPRCFLISAETNQCQKESRLGDFVLMAIRPSGISGVIPFLYCVTCSSFNPASPEIGGSIGPGLRVFSTVIYPMIIVI
jgi:hypothetical protein